MKTGSSISKLSEIVSKCSKDMVNLRNKNLKKPTKD